MPEVFLLSLPIRATADGLLYALVTAGTFAWLWPHGRALPADGTRC